MAAEGRGTSSPLKKELFEESHKFDFFQAVRLLEQLYPERQPVGRYSDPSQEVVRFKSHASLTFPPSSIYEITENDIGLPEMTVAFLGLTGPSGVLPRHYTELLLTRLREKDSTLAAFLDIFNHRLISLFYRAWEKYRPYLFYCKTEEIRFADNLFSLFGLGTPALRNRSEVDDRVLLLYTGILAHHPRSVCISENLLEDYFAVPITVQQFEGQWFDLDDSSRTRLGERNSELGVTTVAGSKVWDRQAKFRIRVGPIGFTRFMGFLPEGDACQKLTSLLRLLAGDEFDFDVQLVLQAKELPKCRLGDEEGFQPQLGWSSWLSTGEFERDAEDVVIGVN